MRKTLLSLLALCLPLLASAQSATRYVGGDISLLPTYEAHGVRYLDKSGTQVEPLSWWKTDARWNAMRVRLFHTPANASADHKLQGVRQDLDYVTTLCQRVKQQGYALMLDIHYSDTWTDPGQHATPAAWNTTDPEVLADSVYTYTTMVLNHLQAAGAAPEMVQVGNEVNVGMMWPTGKCYANGNDAIDDGGVRGGMANFKRYLQAGAKACREVLPEAKIIIHTALDQNGWAATTLYNTLGSEVDYDVIGLSYYPDYHGALSVLRSTINTLETSQPEKEIMVVETGYGAQWGLSGSYSSTVRSTWPTTEAGQQKFTTDLIAELLAHDKVTGLFWWLPEDNEYMATSKPVRDSWWNASLYNQDAGTPWAALFDLQRFIGLDPTGITAVEADTHTPQGLYTLQGQRISQPQGRNVYIQNGRKVMMK